MSDDVEAPTLGRSYDLHKEDGPDDLHNGVYSEAMAWVLVDEGTGKAQVQHQLNGKR
jgi:hypothetical protein